MTTQRREHWEGVYRTKADAELSWFQAHPAVSLAMIDALRPAPTAVLDIGGGQSALAGELVARNVPEIVVLDLSSAALERARVRLGPASSRIHFIAADILEAPDLPTCDLWHDRAVFHFLTEPDDRLRYVAAAARAVRPGGHAIIATFAPSGPEKCSGLPVRRYDPDSLALEFSPAFIRISSTTESHTTPWGKPQDFTYTLLRRTEAPAPRRPA